MFSTRELVDDVSLSTPGPDRRRSIWSLRHPVSMPSRRGQPADAAAKFLRFANYGTFV